MIKVTGGQQWERDMSHRVIEWCMNHYFNLDCDIRLRLGPYKDCYGSCTEGEREHSYEIEVAYNQDLRDFIATIVHEMVHVRQWETGEWEGDGEEECEENQYKITDKIWKDNVL